MSRPLWHVATWSHHLGFRGRCLLFFASLDVIYGISMIVADAKAIASNATYRWFVEVAPMLVWGITWIFVGLICLFYAFQRMDQLAFVAAIGLKIVWGILSLAGWITSDVSLGAVGIWFGLAGLVATIAGWPEPEDPGEDGL